MLIAIGQIYSRTFRMIFHYPLFWLLPLGHNLYNFAFYYFLSVARKSQSLGLVMFLNTVDLVVGTILLLGIPLAINLMIFQIEKGGQPKGIFQETKKYFWRFLGQILAGLLLSFVYALPFACLVLFFVSMGDASFLMVILPLWILIIGFLSLGSISLGQRILLDGGKGAFTNSLQGLRMLSGNFGFFITIYVVNALISIICSSVRLYLGSMATGVGIIPLPISSYTSFVEMFTAITRTPVVLAYDVVVGTIQYSFFLILITLVYLYIKANSASLPATHQKLIVEN